MTQATPGDAKPWVGWQFRKCTLSGHLDTVTSCAFSPDGQTVLSGSYDKTLKLWDVDTGKEKYTLSGHSGRVYSCAFSPDGQTVLSGSSDNTLKLWDVGTGMEKYTLSGHSNIVSSCAFSPDGQTVLSSSDDQTLRLWDVGAGEEKHTLRGHSSRVNSCSFSPDGRNVLSGSDDSTLRLWDVSTGMEKYTLRGHSDWVKCCAFSPDGQTALSGSEDATLKLWDVGTGVEKYTLKGHSGRVFCCAFSPDGALVVSGGDESDTTLKIWDAAIGAEECTLNGQINFEKNFTTENSYFEAWVDKKTFTYNDKLYQKTVQEGKHVVLLDGEVVWHDPCKYTLRGHSDFICACAFSPDGKTVLSSGSDDGTHKLWDVGTGEEKYTLRGQLDFEKNFFTDHRRGVPWEDEKAFTYNGQAYLKTVQEGKHVVLLGREVVWRDMCKYTLSGDSYTVNFCAFSPDGQLVLSGGDNKTLQLWDLGGGEGGGAAARGQKRPLEVAAAPPTGPAGLWTSEDVAAWLGAERFGSYAESFAPFNGADLAQLTDQDLAALQPPIGAPLIRKKLLAAIAKL